MKSLKYLFLVLILILLMAACRDTSLSPIFFTLETERSLTEDRGLEDEMTIHEIVKVGGGGDTVLRRGQHPVHPYRIGELDFCSPSGIRCTVQYYRDFRRRLVCRFLYDRRYRTGIVLRE